jgi:DNA modification methylase
MKNEQNDDPELFVAEPSSTYNSGPVTCLGLSFPSDEERRNYFLNILKEKLKDPEFRNIEGFPIGTDEDILALSDPPYYTACPNPFIDDFIKHYGKPYDPNVPYSREPFAADVSEGKNDPIYNAHSYHTKVPHKAIMRYILHYTEPGDIVFDGFCGTGMTGVAAQMCGNKAEVESLGYRVDKDGTVLKQEPDENGKPVWQPFSKLGARQAVLNDLSPAATFISYNYNTPVDVQAFEREAKRILKEVEAECGWMYRTLSSGSSEEWAEKIRACKSAEEVRALVNSQSARFGTINYTVWSDVFVCPDCTREVVFWEAAVDKEAGKVHDEFPCPHCGAMLTKRHIERAWVTKYDSAIRETIRQAKQVPVLINYSVGKQRLEKKPDAFDLALIEKIEQLDIPYWFPTDRMPKGYNTEQPKVSHGITHVHHFYTKRNLWVLGAYCARANRRDLLLPSSLAVHINKMRRYQPVKQGGTPGLPGTLYISAISVELPFFDGIPRKHRDIKKALDNLKNGDNCIATEDAGELYASGNSFDYIFTDPPFGGNLMYSELNFLWEAWLKVFTNNKPEAIENKVQGKGLPEYQKLMTKCFKEYYRVLKHGRWMTVEFHNSQNSVWNAIQEGLQAAGFVIADVRTLDKQQGSFKQVTSASAVKQDLIISCYKPTGELEERFKLEAGTEDGVWDFVRTHLKQLPIFVSKDGQAELIAERQNYLIFDRMVAFHVQRGVTIPISASEFYAGLAQRFSERDGMYFLPEQVAEYDRKRMTVREFLQIDLFVTDEASAIQWLKQQLLKKPQTFQELHPQFLKEIAGWQKYEKPLELKELLEQNFLSYDGNGEVPSQIHSYISTNFKELRNLPKDDEHLRAKAKDRWYVPDPNKAGDLEKLREKALLKEFEEYRQSSQKRLKVFRLEAVRAGFKKAWQEHNYATIISVANKIPENVLQEDPKLIMWYDQAMTRLGGM